MKVTTGKILGKAHKLCDWIRNTGINGALGDGAIAIAFAIEEAKKWHVGDANDLIDAGREIIDSMPVRLPSKTMLIEGIVEVLMEDERVEPGTFFAMCLDNEDNSIDVLSFQEVGGRFSYFGAGQIKADDDERGLVLYAPSEGAKSMAQKFVIKSVIRMVERTLLALACTNVRSIDIEPPAALNKKRKKTGKLPLFTYKTLHVLAGERSRTHSRQDDDEARRSPRLHFRRGHVRRIGDGRITWVQQCMVGNRRLGAVEKAYALVAR